MIESELMCGILFKTCFLRGAYPNNSGFCQGQLIVHTFVALMTITCGRFGCNSPKLSVVIMLLVTEIAERASKATRKMILHLSPQEAASTSDQCSCWLQPLLQLASYGLLISRQRDAFSGND